MIWWLSSKISTSAYRGDGASELGWSHPVTQCVQYFDPRNMIVISRIFDDPLRRDWH